MSEGAGKEVLDFWNSRARDYGQDPSATLEDHYLRRLEIYTMIRYLRKHRPKRVLDVGCGNGFSTFRFAKMFPRVSFRGVDYSREMLTNAKRHERPNCTFVWGDVLKSETLPEGPFDMVLTQRCIQNVLDADLQFEGIRNLRALKSEHGILLLMECSKDGLRQYNALSLGISPRRQLKKEPFHNLWFEDEKIRREFGAEVDCFCSTYMLAKAAHPRLRRIGFHLPQLGAFGYDRLYIIR